MKRTFDVFKLHFRSPLHVGIEGPWNEDALNFIHSDTIMGALFALAVKVKPSLCEPLKEGRIKVSSAFPFSESSYFLPTLLLRPDSLFEVSESDYQLWKKLKKLQFLPLEWLKRILKGEKIAVFERDIESVSGTLNGIFKFRVAPKVALGRITQNSNIYHYGEIHFDKGGLFIMAEFEDEGLRIDFSGLLKLLGDEGIGGRRTAGYGLFDVEKDKIEIEVPEDANFHLLLSLYWPPDDERSNGLLKNSAYKLIRRTGWFLLDDGRSLRKRPVWMFQEGSVLSARPKGGAVDVTPLSISDKRVLRFGFAFTIPMRRSDADLQIQKD